MIQGLILPDIITYKTPVIKKEILYSTVFTKMVSCDLLKNIPKEITKISVCQKEKRSNECYFSMINMYSKLVGVTLHC